MPRCAGSLRFASATGIKMLADSQEAEAFSEAIQSRHRAAGKGSTNAEARTKATKGWFSKVPQSSSLSGLLRAQWFRGTKWCDYASHSPRPAWNPKEGPTRTIALGV